MKLEQAITIKTLAELYKAGNVKIESNNKGDYSVEGLRIDAINFSFEGSKRSFIQALAFVDAAKSKGCVNAN